MRQRACGDVHGKAVQVDPIEPTLKAPGTQPLKLEFGKPLSSFAFNFNLSRYNTVTRQPARGTLLDAYTLVWAYTRSPSRIPAQRKRFLWHQGYLWGVYE